MYERILYFKNLENNSIWCVYQIIEMKESDKKWFNAKCIDVGDDKKAFFGQKIGIPADTVFNNPEKYDVSKDLF